MEFNHNVEIINSSIHGSIRVSRNSTVLINNATFWLSKERRIIVEDYATLIVNN